MAEMFFTRQRAKSSSVVGVLCGEYSASFGESHRGNVDQDLRCYNKLQTYKVCGVSKAQAATQHIHVVVDGDTT